MKSQLEDVLKQFADIRMFRVEKGEETPRMASLLVEEMVKNMENSLEN